MITTIARFDLNLKIRFFLHFTEKLFEGLVVPFFVIYATQRLDAGVVGSGLLVVATVAAAFGLGGGSLADGFGRRTVLVPAEVVKTLALALLALVVAGDGPMIAVFALYFVVAILNAVVGPVGEALTLDAAKPGDIQTIYSVLYWLTNLGRSIGTIVGVLLFEQFGFSALAAVCCAFSLASAWLVVVRLRETHARIPGAGHPVALLASYREVLADRTMMIYVAASTLNHGIAVQLAYFIAARLGREFPDQTLIAVDGFEVVVTGVMMFGILRLQTNFIAIFGIGPMQAVTRTVDPRVLFSAGPVIAACAFAVMMVSNSAWTLIAAMAVYTLSEVAYAPIKHSLLARIASNEARARYAAVRAFDFRLALIIGALFVWLSAYFSAESLAGAVLTMGVLTSAALLVVLQHLRTDAPATPVDY